MSNNSKRRGCSGTIFLLLAVFFVSTVFVDLDASDINKTYSTTQGSSFSSIIFSTLPTKAETTDGSLSSVNFNTTSTSATSTTSNFTSTGTTQSVTLNLNNADNNNIRYTEADRLYNQLNKKQQEVYNELLEGVSDGKNDFKFSDIDVLEFDHAFYAFLFEHPEFFWINLGYNYGKDFDGNLTIKLNNYSFWTYSNDRDGYIDRLNEKVDEIIRGAAHCTEDYDKVKYVHDYLVNNVAYDYDALDEIDKTVRSASTEQTLSLYGALVNGKCVCGGYSEAFYYLTRALGVNSFYVQGQVGTGYHAWNYLEMDGKYYYMDVTWDDPDNKDYPKGINYLYFCLTDEELFADHDPDDNYPVPPCEGEMYNYYRFNRFYLNEYDFEAVRNIFNDQKGQQFVTVRFTNQPAYKQALDDLMAKGNINNIELIKEINGDFVYYQHDKQCVITLCIK